MTAEPITEDVWIPSDAEMAAMTDEEIARVMAALNVVRRADELIWQPQPKQALASELAAEADELLYGGAAGGGKGLAISTAIPTPNGWTKMGDLQVGDLVFDKEGQPTRVLFVSEVHNRDCYRFVFDDGSALVADDQHRWLTFTSAERESAIRRSPEFRARRRATRPSRSTGKRPDLGPANSERAKSHVGELQEGRVRDTLEVLRTVHDRRGRANHATPLPGALSLPDADLPVDPYTLGAWLGDGTTVSAGFTSHPNDVEIRKWIERAGHEVRKIRGPNAWYIQDLKPALRVAGVLGAKHVPAAYLRASAGQRLELLRGLMDTDGTADQDGRVEFCSTLRALAEAVQEIALSLGVKATLREGRATLNGRDCGPKYRVTWTDTLQVFHLTRKASRLPMKIRGGRRWRMISDVQQVSSEPTVCIAVDAPSKTFLAGEQMAVTHNTYWLVNYALEQMLAHERNYGGIFRRIFKSIKGTVLLEAMALYPQHGGKWNSQDQRWTFPNGSILLMSSLEDASSVIAYQGQQFGFLGFEEVTEFTEAQVGYMLGRLRAPAGSIGIRPHMVATANPGGTGHRWVKRRWVKPKKGDYHGEDPPGPFEVWDPVQPEGSTDPPESRCFVPATLEDNPALQRKSPGYRGKLNQIVDSSLREAMKTGDWDVIDSVQGALWKQSDLDAGKYPISEIRALGVLERVVAVDPSDGNEEGEGDGYGVSVCSRGLDGVGNLEYSATWRLPPGQLARNTIALANAVNADAIIVEKNHGGKWLPTVLRGVDKYANVKTVWASEGKITRARPVAALFEFQPDVPEMPYRARLATGPGINTEELEAQMTSFTGAPGEASPDELDAAVWGFTWLLLGGAKGGESSTYNDQRLRGRR